MSHSNADDLAKHWLGKLTKLNPASGRPPCHGKAPHKPLLLLTILDMVEDAEFPARSFARTAGMVLRFRSYGSIVADRWPTRLDLRMPFYYLKSQGFWTANTVEMRPASSPESSAICEMDSDLFELLASPDFRLKARMVLVSKYFDRDEQAALFEMLGLHGTATREGKAKQLLADATEAAKRKGRCARFAVQVVTKYQFTCALSGYRCLTADGAAIVDAAHIEQWAKNQNDDPQNGLALSKNAHWAFDEGLWSVGDDWRIIVSTYRLSESGPEALKLAPYGGRLLQFAEGTSMRPRMEFFRSHRRHHGLAG
ncbi:MAG: HNH endonuclease [Opitutales bacterium]